MGRSDRDRARARRRGRQGGHTKKWSGLRKELVVQLEEAFGVVRKDSSLEFQLVLRTARLVLLEKYKERHQNDRRAQSQLDHFANNRKWILVHLSEEKQETLRKRTQTMLSIQGIVGSVASIILELLEKLPTAKVAIAQESAGAEARFRAQFTVAPDEHGKIENSKLAAPYHVIRFTYATGFRKGQTYTIGVARCPEEAEEVIRQHRRFRKSRFWAGIPNFQCEIHTGG